MVGRLLASLWLALAIIVTALPAVAQLKTAPAALTADRITYTSGYQILRATGNVVISYQGLILTATELTYDGQNQTITASGPLRLANGDTLTIVADFAELSADLQNGVLRGARMVLNRQMQLSAVEIRRSKGRYNLLSQAAASSCSVTLAKPTPIWQIRARRIVHDEQQHQLYFENARLQILNVPIAFVPRLRVPDPSVKRASGFLVPGLSNSTLYGAKLSAPYFLTLGDYADVKLTPFLFSSGTATLQFDFRQRFANGALDISGAYTSDSVSTRRNRGYLFGTGNLRFSNGFKADIDLQFVSDGRYFLDHGLSERERLESYVRIDKTKRHSYFGAEIRGFRSLRAAIDGDVIPFLLNEFTYHRRFSPSCLGGQLGFNLTAGGLVRASATDILGRGRDVTRLSASVDWRRNWFLAGGLVFSTIAELHADRYQVSQDSTYPIPINRLTPITALELRLPLAKSTEKATQVLEPVLQLVWSPKTIIAVPNDDSVLVDYEATNLFSLNRFAGADMYEAGFRANIGFNYSRRSASNWNIDATFGRIIRPADLGQFTPASGLAGSLSSYVGAAQISLPSKLKLVQRSVFNRGFGLTKNETSLVYHHKKFDISSSYLWLVAGAAANTVDRAEWSVKTGIDIGSKWRGTTTWRYDLVSSSASDAGVAFSYRNECIKIDLSLSRSFVSSSNIDASTDFGVQVTLEGFGSRSSSDTFDHKCSDL